MPALTHGRVVNGFNAYSMNYKINIINTHNKCKPYSCNNSNHSIVSNKNSDICLKKIYVPNGINIPLRYQKSNSCTSQKCRRTLYNTSSKSNLSVKYYQKGIGDSIQKNILNKKKRNECQLRYEMNKKRFPNNKDYKLCKCFKIF